MNRSLNNSGTAIEIETKTRIPPYPPILFAPILTPNKHLVLGNHFSSL